VLNHQNEKKIKIKINKGKDQKKKKEAGGNFQKKIKSLDT
jgi:hypothetical protein